MQNRCAKRSSHRSPSPGAVNWSSKSYVRRRRLNIDEDSIQCDRWNKVRRDSYSSDKVHDQVVATTPSTVSSATSSRPSNDSPSKQDFLQWHLSRERSLASLRGSKPVKNTECELSNEIPILSKTPEFSDSERDLYEPLVRHDSEVMRIMENITVLMNRDQHPLWADVNDEAMFD